MEPRGVAGGESVLFAARSAGPLRGGRGVAGLVLAGLGALSCSTPKPAPHAAVGREAVAEKVGQPGERDALAAARERDTVEAYEAFLAEHPGGAEAAEAERRIEGLRYESAVREGDPEALEAFLRMHPAGARASDAREWLEALELDRARGIDTIVAYREFLRRNGDGEGAQQARERIEILSEVRAAVRRYLAAREPLESALERALEELGEHREDAPSFLGEPLESGEERARIQAAALLLALGSSSERSVDLLLTGMDDASSEVRRICALAVGKVRGSGLERCRARLLALLDDDVVAVKASAALAVAQTRLAPGEALPVLERLYRAEERVDVLLRPFYGYAIACVGLDQSEVGVEDLLATLGAAVELGLTLAGTSGELHVEAAHVALLALEELGPRAEPLLPRMLLWLEEAPEITRPLIVVALGSVGADSPAVIAELRRVRDEDVALVVRRAAREVLEDLEDGALEPLPPRPLRHGFDFELPPGWRKGPLYMRDMGHWMEARHWGGDAAVKLTAGRCDVDPALLPALWAGRARTTGGRIVEESAEAGDGRSAPLSYRLTWRQGDRFHLLAIEGGSRVRHLLLTSSAEAWDAPWFRADREQIVAAFAATHTSEGFAPRPAGEDRLELAVPCRANPAPEVSTGWPPPRDPRPGDLWVSQSDGRPMVFVPWREGERGGFWIDRDPVRRADLFAFAAAAYRGEFPRVGTDGLLEVLYRHSGGELGDVPWDLAEAYCRFYGKELPSRSHWEAAARGCGRSGPSEGGAAPGDGTSDYGVRQLTGSVWQWCADAARDGERTARGGGSSPAATMRYAERCYSPSWDDLFGDSSERSGWEMLPITPSFGFRCTYGGP